MSSTEPLAAPSARAPLPGLRARPPRRRTQAERSDEMRTRLVEAAAEVLRRKAYAGLRTEEVARVAKVSRGALQHHFPSKDALVLATAEHLLRGSLARGQSRAHSIGAGDDPIEAIIADGIDFFLGPDFGVILDLVLAGSKSRALRDRILAQARENRLGVEDAWSALLIERGLPRAKAESVVGLTFGFVRGLSVRALWQNDPAMFRRLLDDWKRIVAGHLPPLVRANRKSPNSKRTAR